MTVRLARADVKPVRQRTQYSCMAASMAMALRALGHDCDEDEVNKVMGARPMKGAAWEEALACAQHYGCRATLTTPSTVTQLKEWTDAGIPVMIAWNPEGRDWSHASLVFDVTDGPDGRVVHVADPNIPNPEKTVREMPEDEFYSRWFEKWPNYLVRRPACAIEREVTSDGRQVVASRRKVASRLGPLVYHTHDGWVAEGEADIARGGHDRLRIPDDATPEQVRDAVERIYGRGVKIRSINPTWCEAGTCPHHQGPFLPSGKMVMASTSKRETTMGDRMMTADEMGARLRRGGRAIVAASESDVEGRFTEGPEGEKEFKAWLKKQPKEVQDEWAENTEKYKDRFKKAGQVDDQEKAEAAEARAEADEEKAQAERDEARADRSDAASKEAATWAEIPSYLEDMRKALKRHRRRPSKSELVTIQTLGVDVLDNNMSSRAERREAERIIEEAVAIAQQAKVGAYRPYKGYRDDPRWITAKYPGTAKDGTPFKKGDRVLYWPRTKDIMVGRQAEDAWARFESEAADEYMMSGGGRWASHAKGANLDRRTLDQLVEMAAESNELENPEDAYATREVLAEAKKFEKAVERALADWVRKNPLAEGYDAGDLMDAEGAYLVLMTLRGEGVGIWDGDWDEFFNDPNREIKALQKFLERALGKYADFSGAGSLNEAFDEAAWETAASEEDQVRYASRNAGKVKGPGKPDGTGPMKDDPRCPYSDKEAAKAWKKGDEAIYMNRGYSHGGIPGVRVTIVQGPVDDFWYDVKPLSGVSEGRVVEVPSDELWTEAEFKRQYRDRYIEEPGAKRATDKRADDSPLDPRSAMMYFDIAFADYNVEDDVGNPDAYNHELAIQIESDPRKVDDLETDAYKNAAKLLKVRLSNEGHDSGDNLICKFPVDSYKDVQRVWDIVQRNTIGGEDEIDLDVPYYSAMGFTLFPQGVNGPRYGNGPGRMDGDLDEWLEDNAPGRRTSASRPQSAPQRQAQSRQAAPTPGGLYGYTKKDQRDCEASIRKVQRQAAKIAKVAASRDPKVATFLTTHAKRAKSVPARILLAAMKDLQPKLASEGVFLNMPHTASKAAASDPYWVDSRGNRHYFKDMAERIEREHPELVGEHISDQLKAMGLYKEMHRGTTPFMLPYSFSEYGKRASDKPGGGTGKAASEKEAAYGLYGFKAKTATLGLNACSEVRSFAGHIAYDLHSRREARHSYLTGFFKQHAKAARCHYARLLSMSYPDAPEAVKMAAGYAYKSMRGGDYGGRNSGELFANVRHNVQRAKTTEEKGHATEQVLDAVAARALTKAQGDELLEVINKAASDKAARSYGYYFEVGPYRSDTELERAMVKVEEALNTAGIDYDVQYGDWGRGAQATVNVEDDSSAADALDNVSVNMTSVFRKAARGKTARPNDLLRFIEELLDGGEEWEYKFWTEDKEGDDLAWKAWGDGDGRYFVEYEDSTSYTQWRQAVTNSSDVKDLAKIFQQEGIRRLDWDRVKAAAAPQTVSDWLAWED